MHQLRIICFPTDFWWKYGLLSVTLGRYRERKSRVEGNYQGSISFLLHVILESLTLREFFKNWEPVFLVFSFYYNFISIPFQGDSCILLYRYCIWRVDTLCSPFCSFQTFMLISLKQINHTSDVLLLARSEMLCVWFLSIVDFNVHLRTHIVHTRRKIKALSVTGINSLVVL